MNPFAMEAPSERGSLHVLDRFALSFLMIIWPYLKKGNITYVNVFDLRVSVKRSGTLEAPKSVDLNTASPFGFEYDNLIGDYT
jgi:hypothetical protein